LLLSKSFSTSADYEHDECYRCLMCSTCADNYSELMILPNINQQMICSREINVGPVLVLKNRPPLMVMVWSGD